MLLIHCDQKWNENVSKNQSALGMPKSLKAYAFVSQAWDSDLLRESAAFCGIHCSIDAALLFSGYAHVGSVWNRNGFEESCNNSPNHRWHSSNAIDLFLFAVQKSKYHSCSGSDSGSRWSK